MAALLIVGRLVMPATKGFHPKHLKNKVPF
jgi:hypothetical protein